MKKKILLTGPTGFVGREIVKSLDGFNVDLKCVMRPGSAFKLQGRETLDIDYSDDIFLEDADWWRLVCEDVDIVVHSAWYTNPFDYMQSSKNIDCLSGTLQLALGAAHAGVKKFIGIGSCSEYETSSGKLSIATPLSPKTVYSGTKAAAYLALSNFFHTQQIDFAWCRLFYLYGEGENPQRLFSYLHTQLSRGRPVALTSGNQVRDYLSVEEAGAEIVKIVMGERTGPINICSGRPVSIRSMAEEVADKYGRRDLLRFGTRDENPFDPPYVVGIK